jgi:hypothetical protein
MAKIQHLLSETAGHVPSGLLRGQAAINIADKLVYANDPSGNASVISSGATGLQNASSYLGVHMPTSFMPVAQLGPGMTQAQLQALFTDNGTTATYNNIPIFCMGKLWWTGKITCPSSASGAYQVTINAATRTATLTSLSPTTRSGTINYTANTFSIVVYSEAGVIYPWFYLPIYNPTGTTGTTDLLRVSFTKTFGAIPVSAGFAGAAATSYWGASS